MYTIKQKLKEIHCAQQSSHQNTKALPIVSTHALALDTHLAVAPLVFDGDAVELTDEAGVDDDELGVGLLVLTKTYNS